MQTHPTTSLIIRSDTNWHSINIDSALGGVTNSLSVDLGQNDISIPLTNRHPLTHHRFLCTTETIIAPGSST